MPRIHLGQWAESAVGWLQTHLDWLFDAINTVLSGAYDGVVAVLGAPHPLLMAGILAVVAWWLRGLLPAVLTYAGLALVDSFGLWDKAMATLSLVLVASLLTLLMAVPLGIWAARNRTVSGVLRPVLDVMQTMPAFVYLIPGVMFFSIGPLPGLIATVVFSMPPGVRMTELGIRQVDGELVEAARAFGTTPRDTLTRVQLPLALPTIMAGVNQVIMLALSMVVIAGMAGAGGLGEAVYAAVTQVDIGGGVESGLAVVILAIYLDRMTGALNQQVSPLGRRSLAKAAAAARGSASATFLRYRPGTAVATVGVVVLALVAGGMNLAGTGDKQTVAAGKNVGDGKKIKLGYFPWDEAVATTYLWQNILEDRGFAPEVKQLDPGPLYTALAQGQMDVQFDSWLPTTHKRYMDVYRDRLTDLGAWYGPTSLELTVPSYVKDVDSIEDLKGKAGRFGGKIVGIESSAGNMGLLNSKVLKEYGLDGEYKVVSSTTSTMLAELDRAYKKKEPVVVPLWTPHWAYAKYDLKKLKDPKGAWGTGEKIHTVAKKDFAQDFPKVTGWLKNFRMSEEELASLEAELQAGGKGREKQSARHWLDAHPGFADRLAPVGA
ncbi:glycine/betaine ABC transporter permease [Streptomyces eurocidicus]|uniref:Glycine betaine/proline transport system substrate-binding protein n=1 Tax=Streptomyces eurocidicus TaxID=66423 RepID=A0A2N8NMC0_STREU|nr:ABC transporter permease/substrate binding protein [Streptomyces eurocidicus]MBB5120613.1 glycine betaine/proline transport system substrate-binding protein [Streptomyces eurocidicus]MBF6054954.1 ABC transporter permease subunit [Streptomyces eurocidicus]PNE29913.1 glycine/betaine ABC transporter permease [Streptomyces eurocidicus]